MNNLLTAVKGQFAGSSSLFSASFVRHKKKLKQFLKRVQMDLYKEKHPNSRYFDTNFKANTAVGPFKAPGRASLKRRSLFSKIVDITDEEDFGKLADPNRTQFSVKFPHSKVDVTRRLKKDHYGLSLGAVATKLGGTRLFRTNGSNFGHAATMVMIKDNYVLKSYVVSPKLPGEEKRGFVEVGGLFSRKPFAKTLRSNVPDLFDAYKVDPRTVAKVFRRVHTFKVDPRFLPKPRTEVTVGDFQPGQQVNIHAVTVDRGYQGVMRRWGYHGLPATHGTDTCHRAPGAIGIGGRTVPRMTKMAGLMGREKVVCYSRRILKIDHEMGVLYIKGDLPGYTNHSLLVVPKRVRKRVEVMNFDIDPESKLQTYTNIY